MSVIEAYDNDGGTSKFQKKDEAAQKKEGAILDMKTIVEKIGANNFLTPFPDDKSMNASTSMCYSHLGYSQGKRSTFRASRVGVSDR